MAIISLCIGLLIGILIGYILFYLFAKTKNIAKTEFEKLSLSYSETMTKLKLAEDRLFVSQTDRQKLTETLALKERENLHLSTKAAILQTNLSNSELNLADKSEALGIESETTAALRKNADSLRQEIADLKARYASISDQLDDYKKTNRTQKEDIESLGIKLSDATAEISKLSANNISLKDKLDTQKSEIVEIQKTAHLQFEKIANQIFEDKSSKFTETNKANIQSILNPLKEDIGKFKTKVEETYDKESKQRFSLEEKVKDLIQQTNIVSQEANNLATALKGQTKKQGDWGEMILERILETSGLSKDREYFVQQNIKDAEGKNLRPDILVQLPDERVIIIDSKVSLVAYDRFSAAENRAERKIYLSEHLKSMYAHIDDLSGKKYDNMEKSLDFTMMFVAIEPAYLAAIQADQNLWSYAYEKRVLLISPTNLIACLKLISDLWKREKQSRNAMDIVKRGELLYEKFVTFVHSLEDVGKYLGRTQSSYNLAVDQLKNGRGNLISQATQLKELGLKSNKKIPISMLPLEINDPSELPASAPQNNASEDHTEE